MNPFQLPALTRRHLLRSTACGFGALALHDLAHAATATNPLAVKPAPLQPKAKRVIFLFMGGGPSQMDLFDPKDYIDRMHGQTIESPLRKEVTQIGTEKFLALKAMAPVKPRGQSGMMISDLMPHLASVADDLCLLRGMSADNPQHAGATLQFHTGTFAEVRPSMGAWVSYGLGTENRNLPSFMVLAPAAPYAGAQTWGSDFLPACHQGTHVIPGKEPLPNLHPNASSIEHQQKELNLLQNLNRLHLRSRADDAALDARIRSFETAFGMQKEAPEAFDLSSESDATLALYGLTRGATTGFGWQCLVARRLAERGVRFLELIDVGSSANWDSHGNMMDHERLAKNIDRPIAGLLADLKQRGMLERTLVVWTTEFGRTPFNQKADHKGREHHNLCFTSWMAGGGVKGGHVFGESDEHGVMASRDRVHTNDLHATILHLLGINHERLTFRHSGRDFRLTDVAGRVVSDIIS